PRARVARPLRGCLRHADHMTFGIGELTDLNVGARDDVGTEQSRPAEALGLGERGLHVWHLDVERHVTRVVSAWARANPAADPSAVGIRVALAGDDAVLQRVVRVDLPPKELGVVALELVAVLPDDLEVDYRLSHVRSFRPIAKSVLLRRSSGKG